jgi:hypothetical protein
MTIYQKIYYYYESKQNIPFRELHNTIVNICDFVKPITSNIQPIKYIEYFFDNIDFDKIDKKATKEETLKYCNAIYYGLEQLFKADINSEILNYQNNISKLSKEQIQETQIKLIEIIGNLKRQARTCEAEVNFSIRYNLLYKSIETKKRLYAIDYQIIISHFNETIINGLLSSFEIINDTFKEITPLLKFEKDQPVESKIDKFKAQLYKFGFFELSKVKQLSEQNKQILVELISSKQMPYGIAMFDELGFCEYLDIEQGTKYKANIILSKLYNENAKDGTSAKHLRRSLIKPLERYKAGEYKEIVKTDYKKLK